MPRSGYRLIGDESNRVVTWNGNSDISSLGESVAIRLKMFQAKLFAHRISIRAGLQFSCRVFTSNAEVPGVWHRVTVSRAHTNEWKQGRSLELTFEQPNLDGPNS